MFFPRISEYVETKYKKYMHNMLGLLPISSGHRERGGIYPVQVQVWQSASHLFNISSILFYLLNGWKTGDQSDSFIVGDIANPRVKERFYIKTPFYHLPSHTVESCT